MQYARLCWPPRDRNFFSVIFPRLSFILKSQNEKYGSRPLHGTEPGKGLRMEDTMITIQGLYNTAVCYTNELEETARGQIQAVCDRPEFAGCKIRIMPDVHAGKGCTIGTTMTIQDKIVPGMVGVDIG